MDSKRKPTGKGKHGKRIGRPPKPKPTAEEVWASCLLQMPVDGDVKELLDTVFDRARVTPEHQVKLQRVVGRIGRLEQLIRELDKPGVGLSGKWRAGTAKYYTEVLESNIADLHALIEIINAMHEANTKETQDAVK